MRVVERAGAEFARNKFAEDPRQEGSGKARELAELLGRAWRQMAAEKLTTPVGENAFETYREVLRRVPGHEGALEGLDRIKGRYLEWVEVAKKRGNWSRARRYYDKALKVDPEDQRLVSALEEVKKNGKEAGHRS